MRYKYVALLFVVGSLASCGVTKALKTGKHLSKAEPREATYTRTFPFEMRTGHLQIPVKVNGADYLFFLDTGAPTAVSPRLARTLIMKPMKLGERVDTLVTIDDLQFGGMTYNDVGSILVNSNEMFKRSCKTIDGLVGANVMNKSIWQINYIDKKIAVSNTIDVLTHITDAVTIPFTTAPFTKSPILELTLDNGQTVKLVYDTGFNGYATLNTNDPQEFLRSFPAEYTTKLLSLGYASILGDSVAKAVDTTYIIQTNLKSGNNLLGNLSVTYGRYKNYSDSKNGVIGNEFFKNSIVTLDWNNRTMYLYSAAPVDHRHTTWGFSFGLQDDSMIVGSIVPGSDAEKQGIRVGNKITEVNGVKIESMTVDQRCGFADGTFVLIPDSQSTSTFTVILDSGNPLSLSLNRQ
jgi:hypothetical protein